MTAQIKILYNNECTKKVHQIPAYIQKIYKLDKSYTKLRLKTSWNLKCMFFVHTNNVQTIKNLYNQLTETAFICLLYIHTMYKLYQMYANLNRIIYAADVCFFCIYKNFTFFTRFVIFKPLRYCFKETIAFDAKASLESRPVLRLIR